MPPLLEVMSLVPKPGHCTISHNLYVIILSHAMLQLVTQQSVRYVQHLSFPYILSDSLFNTPPEMRELYYLHTQFTPIIVKSIAECDNVLFILCKLPIKVLPSVCSALGIKYSVKQLSVFELNPRILKYTLIPVVVGLNNECRHDQRGWSGGAPQE